MKSTTSNTGPTGTVTTDAMVKKFTPDQAAQKPSAPKISTTEKGLMEKELGGRKQGLEPTRYGDWEKAGRCIDF
ncbi:MAG TPA: DUF1674 domain-containing protein [Gammaproteobacteria bacterium]|nr:DUF1674 domain-containing protein [Gammaproteobacteria bacterium]